MNSTTAQIRVRFAPSPTGHLHIGGLRTAFFNWLFARHHKGVFLLRIEDTDRERSRQEYTDSIIASLAWVAMHVDEPVVIQSSRVEEHKAVIARLVTEGKAYKCYCTEQELRQRDREDLFFKYDGRCRERNNKGDGPYVIRFKLPEVKEISFDDHVRGRVTVSIEQLDDFIIARSDGTPVYNFVVVVDDAYMRISHVIRGEEHILNTPKQILLYQACGYNVPQFAHIPLILGPSGDPLSKRDGATSVIAYKELGYVPDALINYLVKLGWASGDQEIFSRQELINLFSLDAVGKKGAIFDIQKLNWLNGVYIRGCSNEWLLSYITKQMDPFFISRFSDWDSVWLARAVALYKERVCTVKELMDEVALLYQGPSEYDEADVRAWLNDQTKTFLAQLIDILESIDPFSVDELARVVKQWVKVMNIAFAHLAHPVRVALIGKSIGPGVFDMLMLVGKKESLTRIRKLCATR